MLKIRHDLKKIFEDGAIHNEEWATNKYFMIKKSVLKKNQLNYIDKFKQDDPTIKTIVSKVIDPVLKEGIGKEFIAEYIKEVKHKEDKPMVFCDSVCINSDYYHLLKGLGCSIYIANKSEEKVPTSPLSIYKNIEFVGLLMPITDINKQDFIEYTSWIEQQIKIKQQEKERQKRLKKCLYIRGNKAIIRKKELLCIADIIQDEEYKNLYVEAKYKNDFGMVFVNLGFIFIFAGRTIDKNSDIKVGLEHLTDLTFEEYKKHTEMCLRSMSYINLAEIKLIELSGEFDNDYIDLLKEHRQKIIDLREQEYKEKREMEKQEEQAFLQEKEKELQDIIDKAETDIINKETVGNITITIYKSRYESSDTSLILYLMKKHNIKVPLKTQGWINKALVDIYYHEEDEEYSYHYFISSANSKVFYKYLNELTNNVELHKKGVIYCNECV